MFAKLVPDPVALLFCCCVFGLTKRPIFWSTAILEGPRVAKGGGEKSGIDKSRFGASYTGTMRYFCQGKCVLLRKFLPHKQHAQNPPIGMAITAFWLQFLLLFGYIGYSISKKIGRRHSSYIRQYHNLKH